MFAIMMVLLLPPNESCKIRVSFESLQHVTHNIYVTIIFDLFIAVALQGYRKRL